MWAEKDGTGRTSEVTFNSADGRQLSLPVYGDISVTDVVVICVFFIK